MTPFEQALQDVRFGLRALRRNPAFTGVVVLTLALGIAVNTAVFSVINTVVLRPLPYPDAARLLSYTEGVSSSQVGSFKAGINGADFAEWRAQAHSFDGMAGYFCYGATLAASNDAWPVEVASIAGDFWSLTAARASVGRLFGPDELSGAVVLSHQFFERHFAGDSRIVGQTMTLDGQAVTIAGVLSPGFPFLFPQFGAEIPTNGIDAYVAVPPLVRSSQRKTLFVAAKLKPGVAPESALTELRGLEARILETYPDRWFAGVAHMRLVPLEDRIVGNTRQGLAILQVAGIFVLLIACANIANLLLARASVRQREIAIRSAVGAGAGRMLRQFLTEGLLLALLGGASGLVLARLAIAMIAGFGSQAIPRLGETRIDPFVLAFTALLSLASGWVFSFGPALSLSRTGLRQARLDPSLRSRRFLVAFELALAIVLLTGAGLMIKSFRRMYAVPPGFSPENTLLMKVSLSEAADQPRRVSYLDELVRRIESIRGVRAAGIAKIDQYLLQSASSARPPVVDRFQESLVSRGYFGAIGLQLVRGRWLAENDSPDATIINETMARRVFGISDPIGQRIERLGRPIQVVGVVANLKYSKLDADPGPEIYRAWSGNLSPGRLTVSVAVRIPGDPLAIAPTARKLVSGIDPTQPVYDVESLQQALSQSIAPRRFNLFLLASFAAAALLLAVVGIYGVVAYSVTQRAREIGIRMALGAQRGEVVGMVVRQGMATAVSGIAIGLVAAWGLTRFMASLLYDVKPNDPSTFALVAVALTSTVVLAAWGPALKAARVDPLVALRHE